MRPNTTRIHVQAAGGPGLDLHLPLLLGMRDHPRYMGALIICTLPLFFVDPTSFFVFVWIREKFIAKIPLNSKMAGRFFYSHFPRTITPLAVAILGPSRRYEGIITASCSMGSVTVFNQCNEAPCNDTQRCGTGGSRIKSRCEILGIN